MKLRMLFAPFLSLLSFSSSACDDNCKKLEAESTHNVKFATYLSSKYCQQTSLDFLLKDSKSLKQYSEKQLLTAHRGSANNIKLFLEQRKDWLQECDKYLSLTKQGRVFGNKTQSEKIFASIDATTNELTLLIKRPKTPDESTEDASASSVKAFHSLFEAITEYQLELQRKGLL
jgi:hypothetical protein